MREHTGQIHLVVTTLCDEEQEGEGAREERRIEEGQQGTAKVGLRTG